MKGNVIGQDFVVEYLQMAESVYSEFCDQVDENGGKFTSIVFTKEKRGDFSFLKVKPSNQDVVSDELKASISELRKNKEMIASMWQMVDLNTSITIEQYQQLLLEKSNDPQARQTTKQLPASQAPKQLPSQSDNLDEEDDFDDEGPVDVPAEEVQSPTPADKADPTAEEFAGMKDDDFGDFD